MDVYGHNLMNIIDVLRPINDDVLLMIFLIGVFRDCWKDYCIRTSRITLELLIIYSQFHIRPSRRNREKLQWKWSWWWKYSKDLSEIRILFIWMKNISLIQWRMKMSLVKNYCEKLLDFHWLHLDLILPPSSFRPRNTEKISNVSSRRTRISFQYSINYHTNTFNQDQQSSSSPSSSSSLYNFTKQLNKILEQ